VQVDGGRRQLRRQRRVAAQGPRHRLPELVRDPRDGQPLAENVLVQTGIKTDASKISGPHADYFKQLAKANEGNTYYFGTPVQVMSGKPKEVFTQVINNALPAGSISVDDVVKQMNAAK
jgi:multiple sugar transport system substrate-binding protein